MRFKTLWGVFCSLMFVTSSAIAQISSFPYSEGFEGVSTPYLPIDWISSGFASDSASPHSGHTCVMIKGNMTMKELISPIFNFTNKIPDKLVFCEYRSNTAKGYRLEVRATKDGINFDNLLAEFDTISTASKYFQRVIDLAGSGLQNQSKVRFQWKLLGDSTNTTGVLRLDDVSLTVARGFDIGITTLGISPSHATRKDSLVLTAVAKNYGLCVASNFSIRFFRDDNQNGIAEANEQFSLMNGLSLNPGDSLIYTLSHQQLKVGEYCFIATIDFSPDENRANDTSYATINVGNIKGDLLINEIMYAPMDDEPEWIELFNASPDTINLKNWRISDSNVSTKSLISQNDVIVPPASYIVIAKDVNFFALHPGVSAIIAYFAALNNTTADAVVLYDSRLVTIDSLMYAPSWGGQNGKSLERIDIKALSTAMTNWETSQDSLGSTPGRINSIAKLDYDLTIGSLTQTQTMMSNKIVPVINVVVQNIGRRTIDSVIVQFYSDSNHNTLPEPSELLHSVPLTQNIGAGDSILLSQLFPNLASGETSIIVVVGCHRDDRLRNNRASTVLKIGYEPRSLVINEIMYDPLEGQNEWFELYNRSNTPVDISQWFFTDRPTISGSIDSFLITSHSEIIKAGEYAVIAADSSLLHFFSYLNMPNASHHIFILNRSNGFSFNNDGDAVILKDITSRTIDSVAYSPHWHNPDVVDTRGRSLERINPNIDSDDPRNWSTCTNLLGGTPDKANSVMTTSIPSGATLSISPNPFSPDGDGFEDFCIVRYHLPMTTSIINIRIYDIKGRLIRTLANGELAGLQGEIIWNGFDDNKQRARIGVYVIFLEASDRASGKVMTAKAVAVVATRL